MYLFFSSQAWHKEIFCSFSFSYNNTICRKFSNAYRVSEISQCEFVMKRKKENDGRKKFCAFFMLCLSYVSVVVILKHLLLRWFRLWRPKNTFLFFLQTYKINIRKRNMFEYLAELFLRHTSKALIKIKKFP